MLALESMINPYLVYIVLGLVLVIVVLLILLIINMARVSKIQKKYQAFMLKEDVDIETTLVHYAQKVNKVEDDHTLILNKLKEIEIKMQGCVQHVGTVRYNAIDNVGADLSFAIAVLDEYNNGFVLNGIYSRDGSYTYAKPIENLQSKYKLSEEEQEAINKALKGNKN
ncbi:MAG: DUF4446 family protein [Cellulosilyticaceae bacterium]